MIVVDASVLVVALVDDDTDGELARAELGRAGDIAAPGLIDVEVLSTIRGLARGGKLPQRRAEHALTDFEAMPLTRYPSLPFLWRAWDLRANLTACDAIYVALAESLDAPLLTTDRRLSEATGPTCTFAVLSR